MQNSLVYNDIIPQNVIESINNLNIAYFNAKLARIQTIQQSEALAQELAECGSNAPCEWNIKGKLELASKSLEVFNEKLKVMLKITTVFNKKAVNVYKKIVSCSRAVRSHIKTSNFSKSIQGDSGDSGDPDQPEPPRSTHLTTPIPLQRNRFLYSWQSTPNSCSMFGGGQR